MHLVADIVRQGQTSGELRPDVDPILAASGLLGALDLAVSGIVIGLVDAGTEERVDAVRRQLVAFVLGGLRR